MAGTFLLGQQKERPGTYFRTEAVGITAVGAINGVCAAIFSSNWGEADKVVELTVDQINSLDELYGTGAAFLREIFIGGAQMIRAYRVNNTDSATAATVTLKNTADTPADALKISARHVGNRTFDVTIRPNLLDSSIHQLIFSEGDNIFETVEFESGGDEAAKIVEALSNNKNFIGQKMGTGGTLGLITQAKTMTDGVDPVTSIEGYTKATEALDRFNWNALVCDRDTDNFRQLMIQYAKTCYEGGRLGIAVLAGLSTPTESLADRLQLAKSINSPLVVFLLNGWKGLDGTIYDGYMGAARLAGMIAGCETNTSLAHLVIDNATELIEPLTNAELIRAINSGCVALCLNDDDQVIIDSAITTLITPDSNHDDGWKKIRRVKCRFELMSRVNRTCDKYVARLNNDSNGRSTILAAMQGIINEMIGEGKLFVGSRAELDSRYTPAGDSAWFVLEIDDIDSLEKLYLTYRFSYARRLASD